jgi:UDP-glucose 4-epimerase
MRILVIGGCGFIGSHVVDSLLARGHSVRVLDQRPERYRPPLPGVEYLMGSFLDRMTLIEAMTAVDAVCHLVSTTFPGTANLNPQTDVQDNLVGSLGVIETMLSMGISRIIYLSSGGTVYGRHDGRPVREDHPLLPINSYGIVKVAVERYLDMFAQTRGLKPVVIRASNPVGPRQGHIGVQGVISTFLRRIRDNEPIEIWGDGTVVRDFFHVADLARLCTLAAEDEGSGTFNAGSGVGTSLNDLVTRIGDVIGRPVQPVFKPARAVDVPRSVLDVTRARDHFGWQCDLSLEQAIRDSWDWLRQLPVENSGR